MIGAAVVPELADLGTVALGFGPESFRGPDARGVGGLDSGSAARPVAGEFDLETAAVAAASLGPATVDRIHGDRRLDLVRHDMRRCEAQRLQGSAAMPARAGIDRDILLRI